MIDIAQLQSYFARDRVFVTAHAAERFRQRGIRAKDIRHAVTTGEIIEQYPDDYPYPSCLILGKNEQLQPIQRQERSEFDMNCLVCKSGTMHEATETYFANLKNGYLIIENVPCWKCDQCGEVVFSTSVLEKIDSLIESLQNVSSKIFLLDYATAA